MRSNSFATIALSLGIAAALLLSGYLIFLKKDRDNSGTQELRQRLAQAETENRALLEQVQEERRRAFAIERKFQEVQKAAQIKPVAQVEFSDGDHLMLLAPMEYRIGDSDFKIVVPAGFVHDRASVPPVLRSLMSTHGKHGKAAIVHDYLYWSQTCDRKQADNLMYIAMLESNVSAADRMKVSAALSVGGESAFKENKRAQGRGDFRVVPEHHRDISAEESWKDFHARLKAAGVADPGFEKASAFCSLGNGRSIPKAASAEG